MVHVDLDGSPVMGSPFPVFFSASNTAANVTTTFPTTLPAVSSAYPNMVNQTMPNMPNYAGSLSASAAFPGLIGLIPGASTGASGGVVLPGVGASLGEICREHINGKCTKVTDCSKLNHPPQQLLMSVLAATTSVGALSQAPMAPSAAAMAAAQAIMAAQALQAHAAQMQADSKAGGGEASGSTNKADKGDTLKKMVQISNLSPLLTVDHIKQLFGYCGKVVDCTITDSKHTAYVEYSKPEEASAALALNNMDVGGRPLNVEMAKSLPPKTSLANSNLPMMMQQAVQLQQMQFQQALIMQQTIAAQQAAARAATMKSATEAAAARAAEISRKLKAEGFGGETVEEKDAKGKSRSPSPSARRSKSRSRSPIKYRRSRRSRSYSPPVRHTRGRRSRSPSRSYHSKYGNDRSHRDDRDKYSRSGRRESDRSHDHYSSSSRRNRSRSISPRYKKSSRSDSRSPKRQREESLSPSKSRRSARAGSRSPKHHKGSKLSPARDHHSSRRSRHSRSRSQEKNRNSDKKDGKKNEMEDNRRRSDRGNRGDKDEKYIKDPLEDKKVDASSVAHKRSSSASEDDMVNSNSKKSKHDDALEHDERKDEHIEDDIRDLDSAGSKSDKRSLGNGDHEKQNHDTNRKPDNKNHDRDDSSRKDRKYREDESRHSRDRRSHHSSSRSHRSSRHSREKYHADTTDQHKSKKSQEGSKSRKNDHLLDDSFYSDRRKVQSEDSPRRKHKVSAASSDVHGINHDTEPKLQNDFSEADQDIQEAQPVVHETNVSSAEFSLPAPLLEDPFPAQEGKKDPHSTVADLSGQHAPEADDAFVGTEESAI
uniref:RRM domain-containing protein n=2 Tax=Oryza brachyantha TaxID=4533 RepID=J3KVK4_ORYBR